MRHALGVLGVLAAGVLLAVSCAMNWRFGFSLGRTEFDGQIYGAASAAADCMKALVPFFFFAALRNRMWSQAVASAIVWVVVTSYSLTSALGHAALNRLDTAGQRTASADSYKDHRADLSRAQEQLSWIPQHRPAQAVQADIDALKDDRAWSYTESCGKVSGSKGRSFCQKYHALSAELASARQSIALEARIADIQGTMTNVTGAAVMTEADPQAAVLAKLAAIIAPSIKVEDVQTALTVFIALLLEVGSGFGMYIAFSQWRLYDRHTPTAPRMVPVSTAAAAVAAPKAVAIAKPRSGANDNKSAQAQRLIAPESDVERYTREMLVDRPGASLTFLELYEDYCDWSERLQKEPLAQPTFGRELGELGIRKERVAGRVRYMGFVLKSAGELEEDKKLTAFSSQAA
jgi:hypothetical protein